MSEEFISKEIMAELKPGGNYFIACRRGSVSFATFNILKTELAEKNISIYVLETFDNPADCLLLSVAKKEELSA